MVPNNWYIYYANYYSVTHNKNKSFFQLHKPYYDVFYNLNKSEDLEMQKALWVPQYKSFLSIMSHDIAGNGQNNQSNTGKCKGFIQKKKLLDEALSHPYFATAFEGLRGSHDIGFVDRVLVYLVNHRMYRLLIFCCRIGIILRRFNVSFKGKKGFETNRDGSQRKTY